MLKQKTLFIDIDGTLIFQDSHSITDIIQQTFKTSKILPDCIEKMNQWRNNGCIIVLVTARPESMRIVTIEQINDVGLFYDQLVMGLGSGERYLVNNRKNDNANDTAFAINVNKNEGLTDVEIK